MGETPNFTASPEWVVPAETCRALREALIAAEAMVETRCAETGCMCDLSGVDHAKLYRDAIHELDSTAALPSIPFVR